MVALRQCDAAVVTDALLPASFVEVHSSVVASDVSVAVLDEAVLVKPWCYSSLIAVAQSVRQSIE